MMRRWRYRPESGGSIPHLLRLREIETDSCVVERISCKLVHDVILQPSMVFTPVWEKSSNKHVCIGLDRRTYFDNHQTCYFNDYSNGVLQKYYQFPTCPNAIKILSVLLYHGAVHRTPCSAEEKEVCLLVLTADGFLKVLHADTGALLKSVFLSTLIHFKYLLWADYLQTVQVKSVQQDRTLGVQRGAAVASQSSRFMVLAVFRILPLELVVCLSIDRHVSGSLTLANSVEVFGGDIKDASINEDLLVVVHKNMMYRFYSLQWIIDNCSVIDKPVLGEEMEGGSGRGMIGEPGFGVPFTVKLTGKPPLVFEARSGSELGVSFGGSPLVYLHNEKPSDDSVFHIRSLASGELIGELCTDTVAFHRDVAEFHFDDYQRVLHISGCTLKCYHLNCGSDLSQHLVELYTVDFKKALIKDWQWPDMPVRTLSGRTVKRRKCAENEVDDFSSAIQDLDYENEMELLYAVVTLQDPSSKGDTCALLCFLDDCTGQVMKEVPLPTWKPGIANSIYYELDCILHLAQDKGQSICYYYRLTRAHH